MLLNGSDFRLTAHERKRQDIVALTLRMRQRAYAEHEVDVRARPEEVQYDAPSVRRDA